MNSADFLTPPPGLRRVPYVLGMAVWFVLFCFALHFISALEAFAYFGSLILLIPAVFLTGARLRNMGFSPMWGLIVFLFPLGLLTAVICAAVPEESARGPDLKVLSCLQLLAIPALLLVLVIARYPGSILKGDISSLAISSDQGPALIINSTKDLKEIQNSLRHVSKPLVPAPSSMEGSPRYTLNITYRNGDNDVIYYVAGDLLGSGGSGIAPRQFTAKMKQLFDHPPSVQK